MTSKSKLLYQIYKFLFRQLRYPIFLRVVEWIDKIIKWLATKLYKLRLIDYDSRLKIKLAKSIWNDSKQN